MNRIAEELDAKLRTLDERRAELLARKVREAIDAAIEQALQEAQTQGIGGKESTPFLLARVCELTGGDSLASNIQLVLNNARLASAIGAELVRLDRDSVA